MLSLCTMAITLPLTAQTMNVKAFTCKPGCFVFFNERHNSAQWDHQSCCCVRRVMKKPQSQKRLLLYWFASTQLNVFTSSYYSLLPTLTSLTQMLFQVLLNTRFTGVALHLRTTAQSRFNPSLTPFLYISVSLSSVSKLTFMSITKVVLREKHCFCQSSYFSPFLL